MQWLLKCSTKDVPMNGLDWIVLSANALGVAIVVSATIHANSNSASFAESTSPAPIEVASLN